MKNGIHIIIIFILFLSCSKGDESRIPLKNVDIKIHVNDPTYNVISVPGTWTYLNGGSRGIIIYRFSTSEFKAFDRHCTYEPDNSCSRVFVETTNITALDSCCGSKFLITDGATTQGPATAALKQYRTSFDGQVLRVFN